MVLIVDDHLINRDLLEKLLSREHIAYTAEDVYEARELMRKHPFDLILLDIMMPGISGLEYLKELRANENTRHIPVILVTALSDSEDIVKGLELGANDYISKPMDLKVVLARVNTQLTIKQLMDERRQTINTLRDAERMREQLFRIATHDLKNPIQNVRLAGRVLDQKIQDPNMKAVLDSLTASTNMMQTVIDGFLQMIELQSKPVSLDIQRIPVQTLFDSVQKQYHQIADEKKISLNLNTTDYHIFADADRVLQSLTNIVSNAIKYTYPETGVDVTTALHDGYLRIAVRDYGVGIKEDERDQLFRQFSNISNKPTGNEVSTGLGLWIVKHLTELQNGRVGADFPTDGGSLFWLEYPLAP